MYDKCNFYDWNDEVKNYRWQCYYVTEIKNLSTNLKRKDVWVEWNDYH